MANPETISVVSPVYGCRDCLVALCEAVKAAFANADVDWELILVDDRGPDNPWPLIRELAEGESRIKGVRLSRNHGQHLAIWAGLAEASGEWVAVIDCDLQDDPTILPKLREEALREQVDAMVVDRGAWSDSRLRRFASRLFYRVVEKLAGVSIKNVGNFGIYSRRLVNNLLLFKEQEVFLPMMIALTGLSQKSYQVNRSSRMAGKSSYSLLTLLRLAAAVIVRFSDRPLKLSIIFGLVFSAISALVSVCLVVAWLFGAFVVPGWTSTILSVWFLAGLIMATLGVHGFYLGRVFDEVKMRPRVTVDEKTLGLADIDRDG